MNMMAIVAKDPDLRGPLLNTKITDADPYFGSHSVKTIFANAVGQFNDSVLLQNWFKRPSEKPRNTVEITRRISTSMLGARHTHLT